MKILQLIHATQLRGAEIFACQLSEHLAHTDNEVIIAALYNKDAAMPTTLNIHHLNCRHAFDIRAMRAFTLLIQQRKIDVIQTNAGDTLKFAAVSKILFGWKAKLIVRNATTMGELIKNKLHQFSYRLLFRTVDRVISVSQHEAEDIKRLFPRCIHKTSMIPIGIEKKEFDPLHQKRQPNILLHIGAFNREKNHEGLIRIFRHILSSKPNTLLWLVGEGPMKKKILKLVKNFDIEDNVVFLGKRNDVPELMHMATLLVLPSITEGLPGVILEAMYSQLPVIANNVGGIKEVIRNNHTGWIVNRHDEIAFSEKVLEILNAPAELRDKIIKNAHELVNREFDNQSISNRFLKVYNEAVM